MPKFYCIVIDRETKKELAEYTVEAEDWYYARHIAADKFKEDSPEASIGSYYVDSLDIDEI